MPLQRALKEEVYVAAYEDPLHLQNLHDPDHACHHNYCGMHHPHVDGSQSFPYGKNSGDHLLDVSETQTRLLVWGRGKKGLLGKGQVLNSHMHLAVI